MAMLPPASAEFLGEAAGPMCAASQGCGSALDFRDMPSPNHWDAEPGPLAAHQLPWDPEFQPGEWGHLEGGGAWGHSGHPGWPGPGAFQHPEDPKCSGAFGDMEPGMASADAWPPLSAPEDLDFVSGWPEAGAGDTWPWVEGWMGEWCEADYEGWPCEPADWMVGGELHGKGSCQNSWQGDGGGWRKGGGKDHWEEWPPQWRAHRPEGPGPRGGFHPRPGVGRSMMRDPGRSHIFVPRRLNLEERFRDRGSSEEVTTLMIRNVPNRYDRGKLMQELDLLGFQGQYNFLYLPIDYSTQWNVGYAFVNFDECKDAERCMQVLEGHHFLKFRQGRKRVATVSVAHIQGLERNLAHFMGTSVFSEPAPWLRPWVRSRPNRAKGAWPPEAHPADRQGPDGPCREGGEEPAVTGFPENSAPAPPSESHLDTSTPELRVGSRELDLPSSQACGRGDDANPNLQVSVTV